jgi:hypothetical protein
VAPHHPQLAGLILALVVLPSGAGAQTPGPHDGRDWLEIEALAPGTRIVVTLTTGEKRVGDFRLATADGLTIAVRSTNGRQHAREETVPASLIATVTTARDTAWNGAIIGAGIGAALASWDYLIDPSEPDNAAIFTVAIGLGTAIGAGIDALVNKDGKLLYTSPRQTATVTVLPFLRKNQHGVIVSIRF